jgi:hypothetical protein
LALAFRKLRPGQSPSQAKGQARLGLAWLPASGLSWHITILVKHSDDDLFLFRLYPFLSTIVPDAPILGKSLLKDPLYDEVDI